MILGPNIAAFANSIIVIIDIQFTVAQAETFCFSEGLNGSLALSGGKLWLNKVRAIIVALRSWNGWVDLIFRKFTTAYAVAIIIKQLKKI